MNAWPCRAKLTLATVLALALSAFGVVPVLAGDEPPLPPAEEQAPPEATEEVPVPSGTALQVEAGGLAPVTEAAASDGFASEETSPIIWEPDPWWCPVGVAPGGVGCFGPYANLSTLVSLMPAPTANGIVWIQGGNDTGGNVSINGGAGWAAGSAFSLALKGGWDGLIGSTVTNPLNPSVFNGDFIYVTGWHADVTISDIITSNAVGVGLYVNTTGKISLVRVRSGGNTGDGANLTNAGGTGSVSVAASDFVLNDGFGLWISSAGAVTLTDVTASLNGPGVSIFGARIDNTAGTAGVTLAGVNVFNDNDDGGLRIDTHGPIGIATIIASGNLNGPGAQLSNHTAATAQPVTLTGYGQFKVNLRGLEINSRGAVTLKNITASFNATYGVDIENNEPGFSSNVTLTGLNVFEANNNTGLDVQSNGIVSLGSLNASRNGLGGTGSGVIIDNTGSTTAKSVLLTGTNVLSGNLEWGLYIMSRGAVTLSSLTALENGWEGVYINNTYTPSSAPQNVTLTVANTVSGNDKTGLTILSYGAITIANLTASENGATTAHHGAYLDNSWGTLPRAVSLTGTNRLEANAGTGLLVYSVGAIKANNLTASGNGEAGSGDGAELNNNTVPAAQPVTLTGANAFDLNQTGGLVINSRGAVAISNLQASHNLGGNGATIANTAGPSSAPQNVTLTGSSEFRGNYNSGVSIYSWGAITLSNVYASDNSPGGFGGYGALIDNHAGTIPKPVTITGSSFVYNWNGGLTVASLGSITVSNISASFNGNAAAIGAELNNAYGSTAGNVTVGGLHNEFSYNYDDGLHIFSRGAVTLSNVHAEGNGAGGSAGYGVYVENALGSVPKPLVISGSNSFVDNYNNGLYAYVSGPITAANLSASGTLHGHGVSLSNIYLGSDMPQNVTLTGANVFDHNDGNGLNIYTYGAVVTANLSAHSNGAVSGSGVVINNSGGTIPKPVTLNGVNMFNLNYSRGLEVTSRGAITISNLSAMVNLHGNGASLYNDFAGSTGGVTLNGINELFMNGGTGLEISTFGPIKLNSLTSQLNDGSGAWLANSSALTPQNVTVTGASTFSFNQDNGISIHTSGTVLISNLTTDQNQSTGAYIVNTYADTDAPKPVTLTGLNSFQENGTTGLEISSYGAITLANISAIGNGAGAVWGNGVRLENTGVVTPQNIVLTGSQVISDNLDTGIYAWSNGAISISNLTASENLDYGAYLYNDYVGMTGGVTITGTNTFVNNGLGGLLAYSRGPISVFNATLVDNGGYGMRLDNDTAGTPKNVTLSGTNTANLNTFGGVRITSLGLITVNNLTASRNTGVGLYASNDYPSATAGISLTGTNAFVDNDSQGASLVSNGAIALYNVASDINGGDGVYASTDGSITFVCGWLNGNGGHGMVLWAPTGTLTLKGVWTAFNAIEPPSLTYVTLNVFRTCP